MWLTSQVFMQEVSIHSVEKLCLSFAKRQASVDVLLIILESHMRITVVSKCPTNTHALQVSNISQSSMPKKSKLVENATAGTGNNNSVVACPGANKENMTAPSQSIQNSDQFSVMHFNVMHFTNAAGLLQLLHLT